MFSLYRVNQQCCPSGNCPETLGGGSPDILAKSLANPDKIFTKKEKKNIYFEFASDLARISGAPPGGISGQYRRDNIAGSQGIYTYRIQ